MNNQKLQFIETDVLPLLATLDPAESGQWGKMNAWQMTEHLIGFFKVSTNKLIFPLVTPAAVLIKMLQFLRSDKPFRENTIAPVLPEMPLPVQLATYEIALEQLQTEINDFIEKFTHTPGLTTQHPVFGNLDFDDWVLLHYKHVTHHLKQFGLVVPS